MRHHLNTEVLVVGAGPVGMLTAILLAEAGVRVTLIDREQRTTTQSYACGLHPRSLQLLARLGLANDLLREARRVERVAFYSGPKREAELKLSSLPVEFPFVLILPQCALESLLQQRLARLGGNILWHHRLSTLQSQKDGVQAEVDQLTGTSTGYIVPHWEWVVQKTIDVNAAFIVGADGQRSLVRRLLGIPREQTGPSEFYVVYEFDSNAPLPDELCVVVDREVQSVCWPLAEGRCRWSFQLPEVQTVGEFQEKDRSPVWSESPATAGRTLARLKKRLRERAPWFPVDIKKVDWAMDIQFHRQLAREFGRDRCWLAGDAAHQTSPAGIQSMNAGLLEAEHLAGLLTQILRKRASLDVLADYGRVHRENWQRLLGVTGAPQPTPGASPWARDNAARLAPSIPATGSELAALLGQLGLSWT